MFDGCAGFLFDVLDSRVLNGCALFIRVHLTIVHVTLGLASYFTLAQGEGIASYLPELFISRAVLTIY